MDIQTITFSKALKNNEVIEFMEGEGIYRYEDKLCDGPTDFAMGLRGMYQLAKEKPELLIKEIFISSIKTMLKGTPYDVYFALMYINYQLSFQNDEEASFNIDFHLFENDLKKVLVNNKKQFLKVVEFDNRNINGTMWDMIMQVVKIYSLEYNINLL